MSQTHTIVVTFPDDASPAYSASTEFQGGKVESVCFGGDILAVAEQLEDALAAFVDNSSVQVNFPAECEIAEKALAKARGE